MALVVSGTRISSSKVGIAGPQGANGTFAAGGTMTGPLILADSTYPLEIPDVGGTYNLMQVWKAAKTTADMALFHYRDQSGPLPLTIHKIFQYDDYLGQPIMWLLNEGGLKITDNIEFLNGSFTPMIRMGWLNASSNLAPALIFGSHGTGGGTVTYNSSPVTMDAGKDFWLRLTDDNFLQSSMQMRIGDNNLTAFTTIGNVGLSSEPGIMVAPYTGTGPVVWYRRASGIWRTNQTVEINGLLQVGQNGAAGVPDIGGLTNTNMGLRLDGTLGVVLISAGSDRWRVGTSGNLVPSADNAYDIGSSAPAFVKTIYVHTVNSGTATYGEVTANPEGVTTAAAGSVRVDITNGVIYFKKSGAGNTGWISLLTDVSGIPVRAMKTGNYTRPAGNTTTGAPAANTAIAIPFIPDSSVTLTRIGCNVTGTTANATARLGIYNDNGSGYPGTVLLDAGTVATATSGWKEIIISQPVTAGQVYWLVYAAQTAAATVTCINAGDWSPVVSNTANLGSATSGYSMTGVTGAFGTWSASVAEFGNAPLIAVKC